VLEGFSDRARLAVDVATDEARRFGHDRVGTEHLVLGLLADADGGVSAVLRGAGATLDAARLKVVEVVGGTSGDAAAEDLPLSARARRALGRAGRFSRSDRSPSVGADHVLLGVLDVEGLGCQVLRGIGVDIAHLREAVEDARSGTGAAEVAAGDAEPVAPLCASCGASLDDALATRVLHPARETGTAVRVLVLYCSACGVTAGVLKP
jgi:ATP-dependent Clp protease ATP-binding subunit ClpC